MHSVEYAHNSIRKPVLESFYGDGDGVTVIGGRDDPFSELSSSIKDASRICIKGTKGATSVDAYVDDSHFPGPDLQKEPVELLEHFHPP